MKGENHFGNVVKDGIIILKYILNQLGVRGVDGIHLAQGRDQWSALMNT
jgi:hypothetical protein